MQKIKIDEQFKNQSIDSYLPQVLDVSRSKVSKMIKNEEILVNGKKIAYGQVVISQQNFGIKITSVLESEELVNSLK